MAKAKKTEETTETNGNIEGLGLLLKEYRTNKMPERKLIALRTKLVSLFVVGKSTEKEKEFMEIILKADRKLGKISDRNLFVLNKKEYDELELERCIVKVDNPPAVHHLIKDLECKYYHDHENLKVIVYVPQSIPAMFQMTNEAAFRLTNGLSPKDGDFPEAKTIIHRIALNQNEFDAWFDLMEDDLTAIDGEKEEQYTF